MLVPFPISFSCNFSVGVKYVVVAMNLSTGDDSQEVITQFIQKENIPIYLEHNLIHAVEVFVKEAIQSEKDEADERAVLEGDIFIKQATKWNHALVDSNLKWHIVSHPHLVTPKVEREQEYVGFVPAYQWIVSRPNGLSTILNMEKSFANAVALLVHGKQTALESLQVRLSSEMDVALTTLESEQVAEVVNKHVEEMEQAQKKWNRELKELKQRQKQEYQNFVKEYYLSEQLLASVNESLHSPTPPSPIPITPRSNSASSVPSSYDSLLPLSFTPTPTPAPITPSLPTENSATSSSKFGLPIPITSNAKKVFAAFPFGKAKPDMADPTESPRTILSSSPSTLPLPSIPSTPPPFPIHTTLPSSPVPSPLYNNDPLYFLNKEGREISKKLFFHETIPVYLGRQRKNLFYFKLFSGDLIEFCAPKERHKTSKTNGEEREEPSESQDEGKGSRIRQKKKMASSLYGNSLSGLVLLVSPDLSYSSETCAEFVNICGASTEFHFDTFKKQLAKVKTANPRLNSGDFFITKHSNLLHVNVVFHLVIDNADASLQEETTTFSLTSKAALGLRNILLTASQCDVHNLVIPAALSEPGLESMVASEGALKNRLDLVNKTVRLALTSTGEAGSLKTIQFVVREPPHTSEQPLYKKLKSLLTTSNKTQQVAYKI